jgi:Holliday junction resolvase
MAKRTQNQKDAAMKGEKAERTVRTWLRKRHFECESKSSKDPCDIIARKKGKIWAIEVKTGDTRPGINLNKFHEMYEHHYNVLGLALVIKKRVFLLQLNKMSHAAFKAWETIRKNKTRGRKIHKRD